ncbi:MAG: DUF1559 domain-containing protein [Isosphaeraceae bacterium]|nr:DUF1559 domain-containing protein [Isosphaeraceae bacterium]
MRVARGRPGLSAVEVVVILILVLALVLIVILALPRGRETARLAACERNLMQIGVAVALYGNATEALPAVPPLGPIDEPRGPGPLEALLQTLGQADFAAMTNPKQPPPRQAAVPTGERVVLGLLCPSDPGATAGRFPAPVSYRATAGDTPGGENGPFAPGRRVGLAEVEAGDGLGYTAAFAERLVGSNRLGMPGPRDYARVPGPIGPEGCPRAPEAAWRGDAGSSWVVADWRSTLYNHALTPGATPSCLATDGQTARMGASSGHVNRVHVLLLDGSVRPFTTTVDPDVWRRWGTINDRGQVPPSPSPAAGPDSALPPPEPTP